MGVDNVARGMAGNAQSTQKAQPPIPNAPTTDGEYTLHVTISSGTATYTWEAVTP